MKALHQEAELSEGRTYLPLMNKHSVKHTINSLCYKKIIFFLGFCLSGENQPAELREHLNLRLIVSVLLIIREPPAHASQPTQNKSPASPNLSKQTFQGI